MTFRRKRRLRMPLRFAIATAVVTLAAAASVGLPGTGGLIAAGVAAEASSTPLLRPARPYWPELTIAQREALAPLADDWERLDLQTKKKWVEIANRYPKMQPEEQTRTQRADARVGDADARAAARRPRQLSRVRARCRRSSARRCCASIRSCRPRSARRSRTRAARRSRSSYRSR